MLSFLFLAWNLSNTTASRAAQSAGRGIEQKGQKSPVGNGGTALGPIPGPCSLAEEVYNAEKPAWAGGNLVPDIQQSPGSSQATSRRQAWGFYSADGWRYRIEGSTQSEQRYPMTLCHFLPTKFPVNELIMWFILLLKINKVPKVTDHKFLPAHISLAASFPQEYHWIVSDASPCPLQLVWVLWWLRGVWSSNSWATCLHTEVYLHEMLICFKC